MTTKPSANLVGPSLEANRIKTKGRLRRLSDYMDRNVLGPQGFCCPSFKECHDSIKRGDQFREGLLSHLGHHYDIWIGDHPLRVIVVGQEYGMHAPQGGQEARRLVSLGERYRMIHDGSGLGARYYKAAGHPSRNPHMRGTTSALRLLFGLGPGSDHGGEYIETATNRFHIFDAFALVNVLLCSAGPPNSSQGRSSPTMRTNCLRHFARTLEILEPTVLVLQGGGVQRWVDPVLDVQEELSPYLARSRYQNGSALVARFSHPSARGNLRWGDRLDAPYLNEVLVPTLNQVRALVTGVRQ